MVSTTTPMPTTTPAEQFHHDGFYVARQLFRTKEIDHIRQTFTDCVEAGPAAELCDKSHLKLAGDDPLLRYPRFNMPHRHLDTPVGPVALKYLLDERLRVLLESFMGEPPIAAQSMFYFKPAGSRGQDLHQDNFYLRVRPGTCLAAWIAIDDADRENGGMVVVPGSQNMQVVCPQEIDNSDRSFTHVRVDPPAGLSEYGVDLKAGDVLFFNGSVIHGSYPNTSKNRFRRALINHYIPQSCIEVSQYYDPLLDFQGRVVSRNAATGGGPCGDNAVKY